MTHGTEEAISQIRERIATARRRTREGLGSAQRAMEDVQRAASATTRSQGDGDAATHSANLVASLSRHEALVRAYVSLMADVADEQVDLAREASTHTSAIAQAGHQMARASKSSQLVAMNALISSARLGDSGGALAVLANEMQDLAGRVRRTAAEVAGLASDLSGLLPQIESNVSAVKHLTTRFLQDVEGSSTTVHEGVSGLRGALAGLDKNAEAAATEVARRAVLGHAALSWGPEVEGYLHELDDVADSLSQAARPGRAAA